jgi:hypothetical protein
VLLDTNILADQEADFFLVIWVVADVSGPGVHTVVTGNQRKQIVLAIGRCDQIALDSLNEPLMIEPSTARINTRRIAPLSSSRDQSAGDYPHPSQHSHLEPEACLVKPSRSAAQTFST